MVTMVKRKLGMHEKLLFDTIQRQAGTLEKANVEGVMNSIEAGCSSVHIDLKTNNDKAIMIIKDDGRGIQSEQEVQDFFETFGTPHGDTECTIWKQFRMGRGQMFAYGKNTWRTTTFRMTVDIKNWGLEYEFESGLPFVEGCAIEIELYQNPIGRYPYNTLDAYKEAIQTQVRFVEIPTYFNGEQINTSPSSCDWDTINKDAYFLFNVGTDLLIYNLGVFVQKVPSSRAGMGGIVVSRKQLKVNFARNDVISDCPVMQGINEIVRENRIAKTRQKRRTLGTCERQATLTDLRDKVQSLEDVKTIALIPTAQGKYVSLDFVRKNKQQWCFAQRGSDLADRMMEREQAICFDKSILTDLNYHGPKPKFFSWLVGFSNAPYCCINGEWASVEKLYVDFDDISDTVSDDYSTLPDKKLSVTERRIIKALNSFGCWNERIINLGYSERANAWTDGSTYITIDRSYLKGMYFYSARHVNKLMVTMAHEMAHDEDTRGTHYHGPEFYENMVSILGGNDSPTIWNCIFYKIMEKSKIEEKRANEEKKRVKQEEKINKKLGIAAQSK